MVTQGGVHNSQLIRWGVLTVPSSSKRGQHGVGGSNITLERPDKHSLSQVVKIYINRDRAG